MKSLTLPLDSDSKWYFTGKPCKEGHISVRLKSNRQCKECSYNKRKAYENSPAYLNWKLLNKQKVCAEWQKRNKGLVNANTRKYQAAKLNRTPSWLTPDELERMSCYYQVAAMLSKESDREWHVDHVVPLQGKKISGLHVPWNLRVIPATENLKKSNLFI